MSEKLTHAFVPHPGPEPAPPDMQAALLRFLKNREKHTPITAEDVEHWLGLWNAESRPPSPPELIAVNAHEELLAAARFARVCGHDQGVAECMDVLCRAVAKAEGRQ